MITGIPGPRRLLLVRTAAVRRVEAEMRQRFVAPMRSTPPDQGLKGGPTAEPPSAPTTSLTSPTKTPEPPAAAAISRQPSARKRGTAGAQGHQAAKKASRRGNQATGRKSAPKTKPQPAPPDRTKKEIMLALLRHPQGATLAELATATGWQLHSVRGFLSGALRKGMGLKVKSGKRENGERVYSIRG